MDSLPVRLQGLKLTNMALAGENFRGAICGVKPFSNSTILSILLLIHLLIGASFQLCETAILQGLITSLPKLATVSLLFNITLIFIVFRGFLIAGLATLITAFILLAVAIVFGSKGNIGADIAAGSLIGIINFLIFIINIGILSTSMTVGGIIGRKFFLIGLGIASIISAVGVAFLDALLGIAISPFAEIGSVSVVLLTTLTASYTAQQAISEKDSFSRIRFLAIAFVTLWGTSFKGANLTEANFSFAILKFSDFRQSILKRTCWRNSKGLEFARLGNTYLANPKIQRLVVTCNGQRQNFDGLDLTGVNLQNATLQDASFIGASLNESDLRGANLSRTILRQTQLNGADLTGAVLTGVCIEDWHINFETVLKDIQCEYIYMKRDSNGKCIDRRPSNEDAVFAAGDFAKLVREAQSTVDLIFRNGIDWKALAISFDKFKIESEGAELTVRAIENKDDGDFVIKVDVPTDANKSEIEKFLKQEYESAIKAIDARYQEKIRLKDEQAKFYLEQVSYERQEKTRLIEVVKIMAEQESSKYDLRGANIGNFADTVRDNARQQANQYNYTPEQKQNLADAASEIQQLLEQLSATYPTTTITEKTAVATKAVEAIEKNPNQKAKIIKAVKAGGIAALKELISPVVQPVTNILFPILEALAADE